MAWGFQCCTGLTECRSCVSAFPPTAMKRDLSDMDSDCDDVFAEDSKGTPSQSNDSCQMLNRKRRRGIIEKRRRDRINNSLSELRRLVPAAFEKQGSAKLEKAEILQMTVDHLKMLHAKGFDALSFDPHKFAMDYHSIGFRECASEVARYLVAMEGMDLQDPLRLRLMSHLQCYAAQRELALKTSSVHNPWNPSSSFSSVPPAPAPQYPPPMGHPPTVTAGGPGSVSVASEAPQSLSANVSSYSCAEPRLAQTVPMDNTLGTNSHYPRVPPAPTVNTSMPAASMPPSLVNNGNMSIVPSLSQMPTNHQYLSGHSFGTGGYGSSGHISQHTSSSSRPYRPWGSELVY